MVDDVGADLLDLDGGMECKLRAGGLAGVVHMSVSRGRTTAKPTSAPSSLLQSCLTFAFPLELQRTSSEG